jgi:four helix bundle protein
MMNFEKLRVYQDSVALALSVYKLTKKFPKDELFGLVSQLRRAAVSVSLNIAEGSSRGKKEFTHFLVMAIGSCYELIALLKISSELNYVNKEDYDYYYGLINDLLRRINALKKSVNGEPRTEN